MRLLIENEKNKEFYIKIFKTYTDARHWIINHLDLSLKWSCTDIGTIDHQTPKNPVL